MSADEEAGAQGRSLYGDHFRSPSLATQARIDANLAAVAAAGRVRVATRLRASAARAAQRAAVGEACVRAVFLVGALLLPIVLCYALGSVVRGALLTQRVIYVVGSGCGVAWAGEFILFTVTFCANSANDLTCPPSYIII